MADSEYDGGFTGEVHTESGTISLHHLGVSDTPREFYDAVWPQVEITEEEAAELRGVIDSKQLDLIHKPHEEDEATVAVLR